MEKETFTFFDYLPDELIIILFEILHNFPLSKINQRIESLYNKFIENVKCGKVIPENVFYNIVSEKTIEHLKDFIDMAERFATENLFINPISFQNESEMGLLKLMKHYINNVSIIYLNEKGYKDMYSAYHCILKTNNNKYILLKYSYSFTNSIIIKSADNWSKFYNKILDDESRNLLLNFNNYIKLNISKNELTNKNEF